MKRYISVIALALLGMTACQKNIDIPDDGIMQFDMTHSSELKTTRATATNFEKDDAVGLFVVEYDGDNACPLQLSGNWISNQKTIYDGSKWTPTKTVYWPESKVDVYGYYPYGKVTSVDENPFKVALDQNSPEQDGKLSGYEASDFLWAKAGGKSKSDKKVELVYRHRMSHLVINLIKGETYEGDFPADAQVIVHNTTPEAIIDLSTGTVMSDAFGKAESITMRQLANDKFDAIIVPQRLMTSRPLIEYIANGVSYMLQSSFYFKPGKEHVLNVTINSNPDQVSVEIGGQIENWN